MRDNLEWSCRGSAGQCACARQTLFKTVPGVQLMHVEEKYKSRNWIHANNLPSTQITDMFWVSEAPQ